MHNKIIFTCTYILLLAGLFNSIDRISIPTIPLNNVENLIVNNNEKSDLHNLDKNNEKELTELQPPRTEDININNSDKKQKYDKNFIDPYQIKDPPYNR